VVEDALTLYEKKCNAFVNGLETAKEIERDVMLQVVDQRWREHLSDMDYLRDGIYLRQVAQQDPLTAWQKEGYELFEALLVTINQEYVRFISRVEIDEIAESQQDALLQDEGLENAVTNVDVVATGGTELPTHVEPAAVVSAKAAPKEGDKIGRNEPCWCGSGRKFKQCHGRP
jgi:preprotein translocase subunit SecA